MKGLIRFHKGQRFEVVRDKTETDRVPEVDLVRTGGQVRTVLHGDPVGSRVSGP